MLYISNASLAEGALEKNLHIFCLYAENMEVFGSFGGFIERLSARKNKF